MTKQTHERLTNPPLVSLLAFVRGSALGGLITGFRMRRFLDREE